MLPATAWHLYQQAREAPVYIKLTHHMAYMQSTCKAAPPTFAHLHNNYLQLENWHLLSSRTSPFVLSSCSSGPLLSVITVSSSASGSMAQLVGIASLPGAWRRGTLYERKLVTHHFLYMQSNYGVHLPEASNVFRPWACTLWSEFMSREEIFFQKERARQLFCRTASAIGAGFSWRDRCVTSPKPSL